MTETPRDTAADPRRILVISTQGLARFVPALGAMGAIRAHHRDAEIILLTAREVSAFAATAPYFDDVWIDPSDGTLNFTHLKALRARLIARTFDRIYDLEATPHTRRLFWLMHGWAGFRRGDISWSGQISGEALSHDNPRRAAMHLVDRWAAQLKIAGIGAVSRPDLSWVARQVTSFAVPFRMAEPFVMIAPSPGPGTAWPAERYADLARALDAAGQIPVVIGPNVPAAVTQTITDRCAAAVDLTGKATINETVFLAWAATAAVGPDNGIMHLTAAAGCRTLVLYDGASDPALVGQRGNHVSLLRRPQLSGIPLGEVLSLLT